MDLRGIPTQMWAWALPLCANRLGMLLNFLGKMKIILLWGCYEDESTQSQFLLNGSTCMNSRVVMMMFWYSFRWNKGQKCSGGRAPHCGQSSSSSSIFTPGCTRGPCRSTCSSSWWPCSVVGVAVCQILDPSTTLAGKGDRRGHQEARLQTSSDWVRIWFVPHKVIWSSRYIYLYHVLWTLQSIV